MQFVSAPQWPQPSQTSSLITTKRLDTGSCPRFWRRRRSLAQSPSWMSTVTPRVAASSRSTASCRSTDSTRAFAGEPGAPVRVGVLGQDHRRPHALQLEHPRQLGHGLPADHLLGAGVRDEPVVEDLERHVGAGRHAEPDVQVRRVEERAVARRSGRCGGRSVYGASPIHGSPSPPSWVIETMCRSGCSMIEAKEWQPGAPPRQLARQEPRADVVRAPRAVVRRPAGVRLVRPRADRPDRVEPAPDGAREVGLARSEAAGGAARAARPPRRSPCRPGSGTAARRSRRTSRARGRPARARASASFTCPSRKPRFSSTTRTSSRSRANSRIASASSG